MSCVYKTSDETVGHVADAIYNEMRSEYRLKMASIMRDVLHRRIIPPKDWKDTLKYNLDPQQR